MLAGIELREIRTFLVVAEELHFGRAADRLMVTQSRVSQTIRTLEVRVGGPLFDRTPRRVQLTALGAEMLERVAPAYRQLEAALIETRESSCGLTGELRLGMYSHVVGGPHLVEIIKRFEARFPGCRVVTSDTGLERDQLDWLRRGELEVLALRLPINDPAVTVGPILSREERIVVVAVDHPLAGHASIEWEDVAEYTVTDVPSVARETIDSMIPPRTPSGRLLRRATIRTVHGMLVDIACGRLIHPTVPSFVEHYRHPGVTSVPVRDLPPSQTALVWLTAKSNAKVDALAQVASQFTPGQPHPDAGRSAGTRPPRRVASDRRAASPSARL